MSCFVFNVWKLKTTISQHVNIKGLAFNEVLG